MQRYRQLLVVGLMGLAVLFPAAAARGESASVYFTPFGSNERFEDPVYQVSERATVTNAAVALRREGPLTRAAVVTYWTEDSSATAGQDYQETSGTHIFQPAITDDQTLLLIPVIVDQLAEGDEEFLVHIEVSGGAALVGTATASVVIVDDETTTPTVSFDVRGMRPNLEGDYVFGNDERPLKVPVLLNGTSEGVQVTMAVAGRPQSPFVADPGVTTWSVQGAPGRMYAIELVAADGATIGEPSRVIGLFEQDDTGGILSKRCVNCDYLYYLYEARFSNVCPGGCPLGTCDLPPYPQSGTHGAEGLAVVRSAGESLPILRSFRDEVMSQSAAGRYYSRIYQGLSADLFRALLASPSLMFDVLDAQDAWLVGLDALVRDEGGEVEITPSMADGLSGLLAGFKEHGSPRLRSLIELEEERLDLSGLGGFTFDAFRQRAEENGGGFTCQPGERTLCLNDNRFWVQADWRDFSSRTGVGRAVPLTDDTGAFWFFREENVELMIKVLDGTDLTGHFWVFYGALSNVEYTITVLDTQTGHSATYTNPRGEFGSVGDTDAIPVQGAADGSSASAQTSSLLRRLSTEAWRGLGSRWKDLWRRGSIGTDLLAQQQARPIRAVSRASGSCVASPTQLCLNQDRFRIEVSWRDFAGRTGVGKAVALTSDTGTFWFFNPNNIELVIKVLDGTDFNDRFWVFYGALSNVEYTLTVTDTETGAVKRYTNPLGEFGSVGDTEAF